MASSLGTGSAEHRMQGSEDESVLGTAARPHVGPDATSATSTDGDRRLTADPAPADSVLDNSLSYDLNMSGDGPVASVQQQPGDSLAGIGAGESASTSNDGLMGASRRRTLEPLPSGVQRPQTSPLGRSPLRIDRSGLRSAPIRGAGEDSLNVSNLSSDGLQPGEPLFEDVGEPEEFVYDGVLPDADPSEAYYDDLQQYDIDENAAVGTAVGGMEVQVGVAGAGSDTGPAWYCIKDGFESVCDYVEYPGKDIHADGATEQPRPAPRKQKDSPRKKPHRRILVAPSVDNVTAAAQALARAQGTAPLNTCAVCQNARVIGSTAPCHCDALCYDCFYIERYGNELFCPKCMKLVTNYVPYSDVDSLKAWSDHAAMAQWKQLMDGSTLKREVLGWQEREDNTSHQMLYFHAEDNVLVWEKPQDVAQYDEIHSAEHHLDPFAGEGLGADFEATPWVPPSIHKAEEYRAKHVFGGGTSSLWHTSASDLIHLGLGTTLYFLLLKWLSVFMVVSCIFYAPLLEMYRSGHAVPSSTPDPAKWSTMTLGNIGFPAGTVAPVFDEAFCLLFGARLSGHSCSAIITALDVVFSFSCLVAIVGGTRRAREYIQEAQRKIVSTSDYTVFVRNLPSRTTEAEVRLHFESLFRLDVDDEFNERHGLFASCCRRGKGKAKAKPIHPPPSPTHRPLLESPASSPGKHSRSSAKVYAIDGVGSAQDQLEQANAPLVISPSSAHLTVSASQQSPQESVFDTTALTTGRNTAPQTPISPLRSFGQSKSSIDRLIGELGIDGRGSGGLWDRKESVSVTGEAEAMLANMHDLLLPSQYPSQASPESKHSSGPGTPQSPANLLPQTNPPQDQLARFGHSVHALLGPSVLRAHRKLGSGVGAGPSASSTPQPTSSSRPHPAPLFAVVEDEETAVMQSPALDSSLASDNLTPLETEFFTVHDIGHNRKREYMGSWVADVTLTHPIGDVIRKYMSVKELAASLHEARAKVKMYSEGTQYPFGPNRHKRNESLQNVHRLELKLAEVKNSLESADRAMEDVCGAFVTFNNEESYERCVAAYSRHQGLYGLSSLPPKLKFRKSRLIRVTPAADPSDLLWENLDAPRALVKLRRFGTLCATAVVVVVCFLIILLAQNARKEFAAKVPNLSKCTQDVPALLIRGYSNITAVTNALVGEGPDLSANGFVDQLILQRQPPGERGFEDAACSTFDGFYISYRGLNVTYDPNACSETSLEDYPALYNDSASKSFSPSCPDPVRAQQCPCLQPVSSYMCPSLACYPGLYVPFLLSALCSLAPNIVHPSEYYAAAPYNKPCAHFPETTLVGCYCLQRFEQLVSSQGIYDGLKEFLTVDKDVCQSFAEGYLLSQGLVVLCAIVSSAVNVVSDVLILALVALERHTSISNQSKAYASKSLAAKFISLGCVVLLVYGTLPNKVALPVQKFGVFNGAYEDLNTDWYAGAGVYLTTVMLVNTFMPMLLTLGEWGIRRLQRRSALKGKGSFITQHQMNDAFLGPTFVLEVRYTEILVQVLVTMMYGSGIPILFVFTAFGLAARYWIEKALLLRYYRKPPRYGPQLANLALSVLPWALLLHVAFSVWMVSSPGLLPSNVLSSQQTAEQFYDSWNGPSHGDALDIWPRIIRLNAFPLFLFFFVLGSLLVAHAFAGQFLIQFLQWSLRRVSTYCGMRNVSLDFKRKWTTPFTAEFGRIMNPEEVMGANGNDLAAQANAMDGSGGEKFVNDKLSGVEFRQGWRVESVLNGSIHNGALLLRKVWTTASQADVDPSRAHSVGQSKRTWQVIADAGLYDYNIKSNPVYREVMDAVKEGVEAASVNDDDSEDERV